MNRRRRGLFLIFAHTQSLDGNLWRKRDSNNDYCKMVPNDLTLWSRTTKNPDVSIGPLACPFTRSLAQLAHTLAPYCLLRSCAALIRSLARRSLTHSRASGKVNDEISRYHDVFTRTGT